MPAQPEVRDVISQYFPTVAIQLLRQSAYAAAMAKHHWLKSGCMDSSIQEDADSHHHPRSYILRPM